MDEEETKSCPNCKREIPAVNFTIHSVHCARNIRICPVCKEPVPGSELDDHHKKMHKLLPCKQCGESVCGTDLEDHIRDSCANTVKCCRFCELELPRRELPAHEVYCGVRTEQCPDCKEYVMIKYQQLHLDSNHGFIRLDDDPAPPKKEPPRLNLISPLSKSNLNRPNTAPSNASNLVNVAQRPTSIFDDNPRSTSSVVTNSPNSGRIRPSLPNSSTPPSFGHPRPNSRPSSSIKPNSSNNEPGSSQPESLPVNSIRTNPRPGSFNDSLGLIFSTQHPMLSSSNSELGSPNSSNTAQGSSNSGQVSSNTQSPSNSGQDPSNTRQSSSNFRQVSSNTRQDSSSSRQDPSNIIQGSSNPSQGSSNPRQDFSKFVHDWSNIMQDSSNPMQGSPNPRQGSSNSIQGLSNPRQGFANHRQEFANLRQGLYGPSSSRPSNFDIAERLPNTNNIRKTVNQESHNSGDRPQSTPISLHENTPSVVRASGTKKRTNDQPQINMDTSATKTVDKDLGAVSRGAVKKRPAPQPPRASRRDLPYYSAVQRQQREERERQLQNEYNLAHGLPPVLNPAQKIEKLRKLDALQNRDYEEEYRSRQRRPEPTSRMEQGFDEGHRLGGPQDLDEATRMEFKNLKPMSPSQFMRRFSSLQVSPAPDVKPDRFPEIKSSLRELRRGLNEVTAPYNTNNNAAASNNNNNLCVRSEAMSPPRGVDARDAGGGEEVQLPCEFCNTLVPADDLVQHQTGCRPDLAQLNPSPSPSPPRGYSPREYSPLPDPVIPCEFCMRSLPVYLINEHQEQCIRENMPV